MFIQYNIYLYKNALQTVFVCSWQWNNVQLDCKQSYRFHLMVVSYSLSCISSGPVPRIHRRCLIEWTILRAFALASSEKSKFMAMIKHGPKNMSSDKQMTNYRNYHSRSKVTGTYWHRFTSNGTEFVSVSIISATLTLRRIDSGAFSSIADCWQHRPCTNSPICWDPVWRIDVVATWTGIDDPISNQIGSIRLTVMGSIYMSEHRLISFEYSYRN